MTHVPEDEFHDRVNTWLGRRYGGQNVTHEPSDDDNPFPGDDDTDKVPDFVVEDDLATFYVEVENDADSLEQGVGQAVSYTAYGEANSVPVVVLPEGHVEQPETDLVRGRSGVVVKEVPPPKETPNSEGNT